MIIKLPTPLHFRHANLFFLADFCLFVTCWCGYFSRMSTHAFLFSISGGIPRGLPGIPRVHRKQRPETSIQGNCSHIPWMTFTSLFQRSQLDPTGITFSSFAEPSNRITNVFSSGEVPKRYGIKFLQVSLHTMPQFPDDNCSRLLVVGLPRLRSLSTPLIIP